MRRNHIKRLMSLALACSLVIGTASVMTACGSDSGNQEEKAAAGSDENAEDRDEASEENDELVTLKLCNGLSSYSGLQMGWMADILREKFHAQIKIDPLGWNDPASADIVILGNADEYASAVKKGLLCDLEKDNLIQEKGTYIYENMPDALNANRELTASITGDQKNKTLYGWGSNVATSNQDHSGFFYSWDIRWDLYRELGYPEIKNLQDLAAVLKKMQQIDPTDDSGNKTYAVSLCTDWDENLVANVASTATAYYGYDKMNIGLYDSKTGKYYDALMDDGPYLEMLRWYNGLYRDGLLDPNSRKQGYDQMAEKAKKGSVLFSIYNYAGQLPFNSRKHFKKGEYMYCMKPEQAVPAVYGLSTQGDSVITAISASSRHKELCMEILNWICTPEGTMTSHYGPKGVCWDYDDEGHCCLTELGQKCQNDLNTQMDNGYKGTYMSGVSQITSSWSIDAENPDSNGDSYHYDDWYNTQEEPKYEIQKDWVEQTKCRDMKAYLEQSDFTVIPGIHFTESQKEKEFKNRYQKITASIISNSWDAIYAKDDAQFNAAVAKMKEETADHGYQDCVKWCLEEAKRRKELEEAL